MNEVNDLKTNYHTYAGAKSCLGLSGSYRFPVNIEGSGNIPVPEMEMALRKNIPAHFSRKRERTIFSIRDYQTGGTNGACRLPLPEALPPAR
jgi:hypothetical protein